MKPLTSTPNNYWIKSYTLSSFPQLRSVAVVSRQSDLLKWSKNPFHFHVHDHPTQLTILCKTTGALDLTDATHTKCKKKVYIHVQSRWQPLECSLSFSVLHHWQLKSISLTTMDTIHRTPCKHLRKSVWQCDECIWEWPRGGNCVFCLCGRNRFECPDMTKTCVRPYPFQH